MGTPISFPIIHSFLVTTNLFTISLSPIPPPVLVVSVCACTCTVCVHIGLERVTIGPMSTLYIYKTALYALLF